MHPDGAIHFFDIKTKRQMDGGEFFCFYVFMSDVLASGAIFFDIKTKRQIVGVDIYVFMSLCLLFWQAVLYF